MAQAVPRVLVYSATRGYRHDSIPTAIEVLTERQGDWNVSFTFTEDQTQFTRDNLAGYDCIFFLSTSERVLDDTGEDAFHNYMQSGGNFMGVHSASACMQESSMFNQTVGAIFDYHPDIQEATFIPLNKSHPSMTEVPDRWSFVEEVYYFRSDPRSNGAQVIMTVDEGSYRNTSQSTGAYPYEGDPHPIAWYIDPPQSSQPLVSGASRGGRSFYTSLGHSNDTWRNTTFQQHLYGGLQWTLDSRTTRAYGSGLVGNDNATNFPGGPSASGASASGGSGGGASSTRSGNPSATSSGTSSQPSNAASGNSGSGRMMALGVGGAVALVAIAGGTLSV